MRNAVAFALSLTAACSSAFETREVTTVHVIGGPALQQVQPQTVMVATESPFAIPPPRVVHPTVATTAVEPPVVVAAGAGPTIRCPAPSRTLAGLPVHLRADASGDGLRVRWTVTASPQARYYRFSERFDANDSDGVVGVGAEVPFTSVIVGDYTVRAEVRDAEGRTAACDTQVTLAGHGLRVELSWNTSNTDVDLHMVRGGAPSWVSNDDCYYANRRPDAALGDESRRRWLDTDDTDGEGPENIRVDAPDLDTPYAVGVHYYSSHSQPGPTTAIVVIYCGDQRVARFERDLRGSNSPSENDFWRVASVRFRANGTCEVTHSPGAPVTSQQSLASRPEAL